MTRQADWYFDFVSPFAYLQFAGFERLPGDLAISLKPVLFAGLLGHWEHKGPAEIPAKRRQTYRYCHWLAGKRGMPYKMPPRHPFNPLAVLRLAIALGADAETSARSFTTSGPRVTTARTPKAWPRSPPPSGSRTSRPG
jgi:2-hydroxychromene-2-carboxylate isomerase